MWIKNKHLIWLQCIFSHVIDPVIPDLRNTCQNFVTWHFGCNKSIDIKDHESEPWKKNIIILGTNRDISCY